VFAGLISAIILMFINSWLEPSFNRLSEDRKLVRETVGRAKRELALSAQNSEGPDA
jgi:biopolymer transport protein ExbB